MLSRLLELSALKVGVSIISSFTVPLSVLYPTSSSYIFFQPSYLEYFFIHLSVCLTLYCIPCYSYLFISLWCSFSQSFLHRLAYLPFPNLYLLLCLSPSTKHIHLYKITPLPPAFPLILQSMPISSACLLFDGACPPHCPPQRPCWSRHQTSDSSISLQLAGN